MGWFSNLFGGKISEFDNKFVALFSKIKIILEDEEFLMEMLPEPVQSYKIISFCCRRISFSFRAD